MNDFTKEELQELKIGYELHQHNTRHNWPSLELVKKIQSMIDNYENQCKHTFVLTDTFTKCSDCNHILGY